MQNCIDVGALTIPGFPTNVTRKPRTEPEGPGGGDGVFYSFEDDPDLIFADIHQDGRTLYPGTGFVNETGTGPAEGTKLNIPVPPFSNDTVFQEVWPIVEDYLRKHEPEFILLQCGADSIKGDPITNMEFSPASHAYAAEKLCIIADDC